MGKGLLIRARCPVCSIQSGLGTSTELDGYGLLDHPVSLPLNGMHFIVLHVHTLPNFLRWGRRAVYLMGAWIKRALCDATTDCLPRHVRALMAPCLCGPARAGHLYLCVLL